MNFYKRTVIDKSPVLTRLALDFCPYFNCKLSEISVSISKRVFFPPKRLCSKKATGSGDEKSTIYDVPPFPRFDSNKLEYLSAKCSCPGFSLEFVFSFLFIVVILILI